MDSRQLEYFTGPNSQVQPFLDGSLVLPLRPTLSPCIDPTQTVSQVDQALTMTGGSASSNAANPAWDSAPQGMAGSSSSTPQTGVSLEALYQQATAGPTGQVNHATTQPSSARSSISGRKRPVLPARAPRSKSGHERKRSKLSTDATPFDSVDYWMDFDNEEELADIPEGVDLSCSEPQSKSTQLSVHRFMNPTMPYEAAPMTQTAAESIGLNPQDYFDDSAIENGFSDEENFAGMNLADHLSQTDFKPPADVPPREGLYSTPLSWERPQPGLRMDQLIGLNPPTLNDAERRRLIAIAMNSGSMGGLGGNLMGMNLGYGAGMNSSFGAASNTPYGSGFGTPAPSGGISQVLDQASQAKTATGSSRPSLQKRKSSTVAEKGKGAQSKTGERAAHNDIERKYRTNLKDKIAELKGAVPALHTIAEDADDEEPGQPGRTPKISKGTVLTKATEYIHHLEKRNRQILIQHQDLSRRLQAFEQLLAAQARPIFQVPDYSRTLFDPRAFC